MDWNLAYWASVILFLVIIALIVYRDRKNFRRDFILLVRKTQRGRGFLERTGKGHPTFWKWMGVTGVVLGFLVSVWIMYQFISITVQNILVEPIPSVGVLLPSPYPTATIGPGFYAVPFWYWIIAIGLLALVHESFHGIMAAREKVRIKSIGWGLLVAIPLAFVEPDEKQLERKGDWPQLRVFAAGSFANFILAAASIGIMILLSSALFTGAGAAYRGYPGDMIKASSITHIAGMPVSGDLTGMLGATEGLVEIEAGGKSYYANATVVGRQLEAGADIPVFEDYQAVKAGMKGAIISIDGEEIRDVTDLSAVLDRIGAGRTVEIVTDYNGERNTYSIMTKEEPAPVFSPSFDTLVLGSLEHVMPGISGSMESAFMGFYSIFGASQEKGWSELQLERGFWEFLGKAYPGLSDRSAAEISRIEAELAGHPPGGFIGIADVSTRMVIVSGLEPVEGAMNFIVGLLFWMFLINLGVGAFNLLPIKPLDGGRMWDILLRRISRNYGKPVMKVLSYITFLLIIFNFLILLF